MTLSPDHLDWLDRHRGALLTTAAKAVHPDGGFAWLGDDGRPRLDHDVELWITTRMTHVAALGVLEGRADLAAPLVAHGVSALTGRLQDPEHGGWYAAVNGDRATVTDKQGYGHAFVVLAASSAVAAGAEGAKPLLDTALEVWSQRFWREEDGLAVDVWNRDWTRLEDYRGANANMHGVEAMLAAGDVTGDRVWFERAARVTERVVHGFAADHDWRLPEHFTTGWEPVLDYNRDEPRHPFRPYGVTIGHLLEWSRLALQVRLALGDAAPAWLLEDAGALFDKSVAEGWAVDGAEGFVYTTDFEGEPVVSDRLHWVVTEAIGAAWALYDATGDAAYLHFYEKWWDHARRLFVDEAAGSWRHELDARNQPSAHVWDGRPDIYHAYQAALLPRLGSCVSFAGGLTRR